MNNDKEQTKKSFSQKWSNNIDLAFSETLRPGSDIHDWILGRNGFVNEEAARKWLSKKQRILDAGCGNGRVTALIQKLCNKKAEIFGIDLTASHIAATNLKDVSNVHFEKKDLLEDLSSLGIFDLIYCQEVLHHTASPVDAFNNLVKILAPGGEIAIYVYKYKAPIREFTDDFVREKISALSYEEAMLKMDQITNFGKVLSELKVNVEVPSVDVLGIKKGTYDIQRLIYHFFAKCFWNSDLNYNQNSAINYDWYHPQLCTRHTLEEVQDWFYKANLEIIHEKVDHYGITVRGYNKK
jgi:SAM-dependent methyltransferase